jgi:hypothetical protein
MSAPTYIKVLGIIVAVSALFGVLGLAYYEVKDSGKKEAELACMLQREADRIELEKRIQALSEGMGIIAQVASEQRDVLSQDIGEILNRVKSKPVTIVKNGKCEPATEFLDSLNQAINRANQK